MMKTFISNTIILFQHVVPYQNQIKCKILHYLAMRVLVLTFPFQRCYSNVIYEVEMPVIINLNTFVSNLLILSSYNEL